MNTVNAQEVVTQATKETVENAVVDTQNGNADTVVDVVDNGVANEPYKVFATQAEFDRHAVGILNNAKMKAEKELLGLLGLKAGERDKLLEMKKAYDDTLTEHEKQAQSIASLTGEVESLKRQLEEKSAVILALGKITGKNGGDVDKVVRMARGLVDENTSIEDALNSVLQMTVAKPKEANIPASRPLQAVTDGVQEDNPFKTGNLTNQGRLLMSDRDRAREMYIAAYGKPPSW